MIGPRIDGRLLHITGVHWDSRPPVPWRRLVREWLIYTGVAAVVLALFFRSDLPTLIVGVLASGPVFIVLGAVMAKFGYTRKTLAELRTPRASTSSTSTSAPAAGASLPARPHPPDISRHQPTTTQALTPPPNRDPSV